MESSQSFSAPPHGISPAALAGVRVVEMGQLIAKDLLQARVSPEVMWTGSVVAVMWACAEDGRLMPSSAVSEEIYRQGFHFLAVGLIRRRAAP